MWKKVFQMGNGHSQPQNQGQRHNYDGPLFGGHYPGDFSIRRQKVDVNKPLPPTPPSKSVQFGSNPPAWVFYKNRPTDENLGNTRYCSPRSTPQQQQQQQRRNSISPPPAYGIWNEGGWRVANP